MSSSIVVEAPDAWRVAWKRVLDSFEGRREELPMHALCWCLEQLANAGVELVRATMFVAVVWSRFRRKLGEVPTRVVIDPWRPTPSAGGAPGGRRMGDAEWDEVARLYERELEKEAQRELEAFEAFCRRCSEECAAFGDVRTFVVNALCWCLETLYRRGYSDAELATAVEQTWQVVQFRREQASRRAAPPPAAPFDPFEGFDPFDSSSGRGPLRPQQRSKLIEVPGMKRKRV